MRKAGVQVLEMCASIRQLAPTMRDSREAISLGNLQKPNSTLLIELRKQRHNVDSIISSVPFVAAEILHRVNIESSLRRKQSISLPFQLLVLESYTVQRRDRRLVPAVEAVLGWIVVLSI